MNKSTTRNVMAGFAAAAGILLVAAPATATTVNEVSGTGTREAPYVKACNEGTPFVSSTCQVDFPYRTVKGLDSENMENYQCPADRPYLEDKVYSPGAVVPHGVQIRNLAPAGVIGIGVGFVMEQRLEFRTETGRISLPTGTTGGTVTNWNTDSRPFGVTLHCTDRADDSNHSPFTPWG